MQLHAFRILATIKIIRFIIHSTKIPRNVKPHSKMLQHTHHMMTKLFISLFSYKVYDSGEIRTLPRLKISKILTHRLFFSGIADACDSKVQLREIASPLPSEDAVADLEG